ncbi:MAG: phosphoribosylformylglycinamidine cyclo-ligase [Myxococcales bacterium]|nr:phosphoribosylformylglycinamidine cyclo-ligase [Myxococcales bacterium]
MAKLTYRDAGVDIEKGGAVLSRFTALVKKTRRPEVIGDLGGFAGLCALPMGHRDPVLVSGTDGVGTKLKVAFALGKHDTVGIDLVAMCANDVSTTGADPLFFHDYFATGALDVAVAEAVIGGIAEGCRRAGCALLGGETAELPGMYAPNEYDLAGFAVGVIDREKLVDGRGVKVGDVVIGVGASGLHSNGYALARKALLEVGGYRLDQHVDDLGATLGEALLEPTHIYARAVSKAMRSGQIRAIAHVTGGGLGGNIPRVLPEGVGVALDLRRWQRPVLFDLIQRAGDIEEAELRRTFNLGLGMVVIASAQGADTVLRAFRESGFGAAIVGEVVPSEAEAAARVSFRER